MRWSCEESESMVYAKVKNSVKKKKEVADGKITLKNTLWKDTAMKGREIKESTCESHIWAQ